MPSEILSTLLLIGTVGSIVYIILKRSTDASMLYAVNLLGVLLAGPAAMATAMQGANNSSSMIQLFFVLCLMGIPISLICTIVAYFLNKNGKKSQALFVVKIPIVYAGLWVIGFFSGI